MVRYQYIITSKVKPLSEHRGRPGTHNMGRWIENTSILLDEIDTVQMSNSQVRQYGMGELYSIVGLF